MTTPSATDLHGFLLGTLPPDEAERVVTWAMENSASADVLRGVSAHDALTEVLLSTTHSTEPSSPEVEQIIRTITHALGISPPSSEIALLPERIGGYRVVRELGRGGMGVVYEAVDEKLNRLVALKVMRAGLAAKDQARQRFLREAQAVAALKSDHIVTIFQVGETDEGPFLAMEYLDGVTLDGWLNDRLEPISMDDVFWIARDVLSGLAAAHAKGLVHRDIKPANLWVERDTGRVKVLDFGLTRGFDTPEQITNEGAVVGTPAYMAPEQASGKPLDARADLFSVGVVLYRMLTGRSPFQRDSMMATLTALATETPEPVREVHPELSWFIARLMAKDSAARPADAKLALAELQSVEDRLKAEPARPHRRSSLVRRAVAAVLFAAIALAGVVIYLKTRDGTIEVKLSNPNVLVFIDDKEQPALDGNPMVRLKLKPGKHRFSVKRDGKEAYGIEFEVKPGEITEWSAEVPPEPLPPAGSFPGENPLDALDASKIPIAERFPWQPKEPKELVAVVGEHRQRDSASFLAASSDSKRIANDVVIWDVETQRIIQRLPNSPWVPTFTPDGRRLITDSHIWDISGAEPKKIGQTPDDLGTFRCFTPDGKMAITFSTHYEEQGKCYVTLWDVNGDVWKLRHRFPKTSQFALSPDGIKIAVGAGETGIVKLYSLAKREPVEIASLPVPVDAKRYGGDWAGSMGFVSNDQLVTLREGILRLWDVSGMQPRELAQGNCGGSYVLAVQATKRILSFGGHVNCEIWDASGGKLTQTGVTNFGDRVASNLSMAALTPDGKVVVTTHANATIRFWDVAERQLVERQPLKIQPYSGTSLANGGNSIALGGRYLISETEVEQQLGLWDLGGPNPIRVGDFSGKFPNLSPDGSRFIGSDDRLPVSSIYEVKNGKIARLHRLPFHVSACVWSADSRTIAISDHEGGLSIYDVTDSLQEKCRFDSKRRDWPRDALFFLRPDGSRLLIFGQDAGVDDWQISLFCVADGKMKRLSQTSIKADPRFRAIVSPDCKTLLMNDRRRWDVSGDVLRPLPDVPLPGYEGYGFSIQFLPDNRTIAFSTSSSRAVVGLFDLENNRIVQSWDFPGRVATLTVSGDGRYLITGNTNGTIYVLRLAPPPK